MQFQLAPQHLPISAEQEICANCNSNSNNNCQEEVNDEEEEREEQVEEEGEDEAEAAEQLLAKNRTHPRSSLTQNHYVIKVAITADSKNRKLEHGTQTGWRRRDPRGEGEGGRGPCRVEQQKQQLRSLLLRLVKIKMANRNK